MAASALDARIARAPLVISIRRALPADFAAITTVQRLSLRTLARAAYTGRQIESFLRHVPTLEPYLIEDGTYYVATSGDDIVGCGGWSVRKPTYDEFALMPAHAAAGIPVIRALYVHPGFTRRGIARDLLLHAERAIVCAGHAMAELDALLSSVPLYRACGYRNIGDTQVALPDGEQLRLVCMARALDRGEGREHQA